MATKSDTSNAALLQMPLANPSDTEVPVKATLQEMGNPSLATRKFPCAMSWCKADKSLSPILSSLAIRTLLLLNFLIDVIVGQSSSYTTCLPVLIGHEIVSVEILSKANNGFLNSFCCLFTAFLIVLLKTAHFCF